MGKRIQAGRNKEAPLGIVGSDESLQQAQAYTPESQEYYQELVKGFLAKLTRWNEVLTTNGNGIYVLENAGNLTIVPIPPASPLLIHPTHLVAESIASQSPTPYENAVLRLEKGTISITDPKLGMYDIEFFAHPGNTKKTRLVDPENRPLQQVKFYADTQPPVGAQELRIEARYPASRRFGDDNSETRSSYIRVSYHFRYGELMPPHDPSTPVDMPDAYAIHLFNTVDALIPSTTTTALQPRCRATAEASTQKRLPPVRRRTLRG